MPPSNNQKFNKLLAKQNLVTTLPKNNNILTFKKQKNNNTTLNWTKTIFFFKRICYKNILSYQCYLLSCSFLSSCFFWSRSCLAKLAMLNFRIRGLAGDSGRLDSVVLTDIVKIIFTKKKDKIFHFNSLSMNISFSTIPTKIYLFV